MPDILWTWEVKANTGPDGKNALAFAKVPMIAKAVSKACADEGGLIGNPAACRFEPRSLQCEAADSPNCLTSAEVAVVEKWYSGPKNSKGEQLNPGFSRGTEPYWTEWPNGTDEASWRRYKAGIGDFFRYYGFIQDPGPDYSVDRFDFDKDPPRLVVGLNRDASSTDLAKFKARGGKILIWHGLADEEIPAEGTQNWYEDLTKAMGGVASTRDFARLFMIPGMSHCGAADGPGAKVIGPQSGFDPLPVFERYKLA